MQIDYADDGAGIPKHSIPHLRALLYHQAGQRRRPRLGLYIVYNLVTGVLGGTVRLRSQPGQGAAFDLVLPAVASEAPGPSSRRGHFTMTLLADPFPADPITNTIFWIDPDGRILDASDETCHALGYDQETLR
ncbi:MAG: sensor histidine kinase [Candidatus Competibacteraceae bacterium]